MTEDLKTKDGEISDITDITDENDAESVNADEESSEPVSEEKGDTGIDYNLLMTEDLESLKGEFPELSGIGSITELENPMRYAALRDLGLSPAEAYLATSKKRRAPNTRAHLQSAVPKFAAMPRGSMSEQELIMARELFGDLSDREIKKLYRKVTV